MFSFGLFNCILCLAYHVCNDLALTAVNLRAICRLFYLWDQVQHDFAIDGFLVFVDSDINENFVRDPNVHEML